MTKRAESGDAEDSALISGDRAVKFQTNVAFKEWALICRAIAAGRQTIILRKGGIAEKRSGFQVEHREFFLFPTLFHQQNEAVIPDARAVLEAPSQDTVTLSLFAEVTDARRLTDWGAVRALAPFHVWTEETIRNRFGWGRENALTLILARFYQLPAPVTLPLQPAYSGCASWVVLEKTISAAGARPILDGAEFAARVAQIRAVLG